MVVVVVENRSRRGLPRLIGRHAQHRAVAEFDDDLHQRHRPVAIGVAVAGRFGDIRFLAEPTVPQHQTDCVGAPAQQAGDIVNHVEHPTAEREGLVVVVIGCCRVEDILPDLAPIDRQLKISEARDIGPRPRDLGSRSNGKLPPQQRCRDSGVGRRHPAAAPIARIQQTHFEVRRRAVVAAALC